MPCVLLVPCVCFCAFLLCYAGTSPWSPGSQARQALYLMAQSHVSSLWQRSKHVHRPFEFMVTVIGMLSNKSSCFQWPCWKLSPPSRRLPVSRALLDGTADSVLLCSVPRVFIYWFLPVTLWTGWRFFLSCLGFSSILSYCLFHLLEGRTNVCCFSFSLYPLLSFSHLPLLVFPPLFLSFRFRSTSDQYVSDRSVIQNRIHPS